MYSLNFLSESCCVTFFVNELFAAVEDSSTAGWNRVFVDGGLMRGDDDPDSGRSLTRYHGAPGKEKLVKAVCELAVLLLDLLLVLDDVVVPSLDSVCVVHALVAHRLDLETSPLELARIPVHGAGRISTREDVLTHEVAPDQIFKLPLSAESGNLQHEQTVRLQETLDLSKECLIVTDADMLAHLEAGDLVELSPNFIREFSVVKEIDVDLVLEALLRYSFLPIFKLTRGYCHSGALHVEVLCHVDDPGGPAAAEIDQAVTVFHVEQLADDAALAVLSSLQVIVLLVRHSA